MGISGAALLAGTRPGRAAAATATSPCIVRPQQTEGPFFVEEDLNRSDIRSDPRSGVVQAGVPLQLTFRVSRMTGASCAPLAGAQVDVWHCNASGRYSDTRHGGGSGSDGDRFLRGYQPTDAAGTAQFLTIYPGWYDGRTVHMHFKVRTVATSAPAYEFTSQLYFDDALTDRVHAFASYAAVGRRSMRNADDFLFRDGGSRLLLDATHGEHGYAAAFDVGLQFS
jgi:protocatechuate 3,4-dioxygenase beta subunit